jgi:plasmid stabilization system protein ParE
MDFEVFLSADALNDLERIVAYIALDNVVAAARMGNQLLDAALSLATFSERGRTVPSSGGPNCAKLFSALIASFTA